MRYIYNSGWIIAKKKHLKLLSIITKYNQDISNLWYKTNIIQSHCIVFDDSQLLITIGNDGQLNLYKQNHVKQYEHQTTCKMYLISQHSFDSPVLCYDIKQNSNCWRLVLMSIDNRIAACKIVNKKEIIVFRQMDFQQRNEQIVSCVWLGEQNEIVLGGLKGYIFIFNLETR